MKLKQGPRLTCAPMKMGHGRVSCSHVLLNTLVDDSFRPNIQCSLVGFCLVVTSTLVALNAYGRALLLYGCNSGCNGWVDGTAFCESCYPNPYFPILLQCCRLQLGKGEPKPVSAILYCMYSPHNPQRHCSGRHKARWGWRTALEFGGLGLDFG